MGGHPCRPRPLGGRPQAPRAEASTIAPSAAAELTTSSWVPFTPHQQPPATSPAPRILKYRGISPKEEEGWDPLAGGWDGSEKRCPDLVPRKQQVVCVGGGGAGCGSVTKPSDDHPRDRRPSPCPQGGWLPPRRSMRGGTPFSGCDGGLTYPNRTRPRGQVVPSRLSLRHQGSTAGPRFWSSSGSSRAKQPGANCQQ